MKKIFVIEDADDPESMRIMKNRYTGVNLLFEDRNKARDAVMFLTPIQPVMFVEVEE